MVQKPFQLLISQIWEISDSPTDHPTPLRINPKYYRLLGWPETEKVNEEENVEKESEEAVSVQPEEVVRKL